jgi:predicted TIM-barrel fold metal-dependent hydrolase
MNINPEFEVPNSSGGAPPKLETIPGACDSHIHIFDSRFPDAGPAHLNAARATAGDYRLLQRRLGTQRTVVVTARVYDTDNRVTLDAIEALGRDRTRGVARVRADVSDAELATLHTGGIRGIRFSLHHVPSDSALFSGVEQLAQRVAMLGWHVQLHWNAEQIVAHSALLSRLPGTMVFDHLGRIPPSSGVSHPAFAVIRRLLDAGRTWVKLSGVYLDTRAGPPYADMHALGRAFAHAAPERMVWGSDWPHVSETDKPDDAVLLDLLLHWVPEAGAQRRILVDNPAQLYGFNPQ